MYYIWLDVHRRTIGYCLRDPGGQAQQRGTIPAIRVGLDGWMTTPSAAMDGGDGGNHLHRLNL
jgi:hypothetical protein